jgi:hypothetical protein
VRTHSQQLYQAPRIASRHPCVVAIFIVIRDLETRWWASSINVVVEVVEVVGWAIAVEIFVVVVAVPLQLLDEAFFINSSSSNSYVFCQ